LYVAQELKEDISDHFNSFAYPKASLQNIVITILSSSLALCR